ncbi:S8 family peptidase [Bacillus daqingensis]|uniref:S8 family peptidase n=1 Tax=Bacillus daqingensis TaxID=872396 RepID=A0ABV9NU25_9BACI
MKKVLFMTAAAALFAVPMSAGAVSPQGETEKQEYLVEFSGPAEAGLMQAFGISETDVLHTYDLLDVQLVELSEAQVPLLENHPQIEAVDENAEVTTLSQTVPYGIDQVQATDAYAQGISGDGVSVAVLDTGIDADHEDLADNVVGGYSVFSDADNSNPFFDGNGHGTHVAGTVAAVDNDLGVIGAAPDADLYAVKVLSNSGSGSLAGIAEGIEWSIENDIDIINMSLGGSSGSSVLESFTDLAFEEGSLVIAAAGNSGNRGGNNDTVGFPAKYDSAMAVAAVDATNNRATFSSAGPAVEISAPGVDVLSTVPGNGYASFNGTSMAAPHVAGVAAQVWQAKPELSSAELRDLLNDTAVPLGASHQYGSGLVQSLDAIND